jgi:hypothetical protein
MSGASASLLVVLVLAKLFVIGFANPWFFAQDVGVAIAFGVLEFALRGRKWIWIPYGVAVAWIAINVPVALVLGSWLTWPMLEAAGGPLADSIRYYLTPSNLLPLASVLAAGLALPLVFRRKTTFLVTSGCVALVAGLTATPRSTNGFGRTPLTALAKTTSGVVFPKTTPDVVFSRFHGAAKGMNVAVVILESTAAQYLGLYGAGEDPIPGVTGKLVVDGLTECAPAKRVLYLPHRTDVVQFLLEEVRPGDRVLTLGAGDITTLAEELVDRVRMGPA